MPTAFELEASFKRDYRAMRLAKLILFAGWFLMIIGMMATIVIGAGSLIVTGTLLLLCGIFGWRLNRAGDPFYLTLTAWTEICMPPIAWTYALTHGWLPKMFEAAAMLLFFVIVGVLYAFLHLAGTGMRAYVPPWNCKACGYKLIGLVEPRCPECGLAYDRADVLDTLKHFNITDADNPPPVTSPPAPRSPG
jgi:hypothetical protein